jgi:hypothetical protein
MTLYESLKKFVDGEYESNFARDFNYSYDNLKFSKINENDLSKSIMYLMMDRQEFLTMIQSETFADHTNNEYYINVSVGGGYHGRVFLDNYSAEQDFAEGYTIRHFSEENIEKLKEILKLINKKLLTQFIEGGNDDIVSQYLLLKFQDECESIAHEYAEHHDECLVEGMKEYLRQKKCGILNKFKIMEMQCQRKYVTTVGNIIKLYEKYGHFGNKDKDILTLLHAIINEEGLEDDDDYGDDYYAYYEERNFDREGFNRWVGMKLDKMMDKIEEDFDPESMEKENKLYDLMEKLNYTFNRWYYFPEEKQKKDSKSNFMIEKFEDGKILVTYNEMYKKMEHFKMGFEDFINFLYHPELFD